MSGIQILSAQLTGGLAERFIAAVLNTAGGFKLPESSNLSPSATKISRNFPCGGLSPQKDTLATQRRARLAHCLTMFPFCMTCQRPVCLAWHRRCCDGQQSTTILHQAPSPIHQKPNQRLKGTPWIPYLSSVLPHFPSIRCSKRHSNRLSEGVNTFYGQKYGSKSDYLATNSNLLGFFFLQYIPLYLFPCRQAALTLHGLYPAAINSADDPNLISVPSSFFA